MQERPQIPQAHSALQPDPASIHQLCHLQCPALALCQGRGYSNHVEILPAIPEGGPKEHLQPRADQAEALGGKQKANTWQVAGLGFEPRPQDRWHLPLTSRTGSGVPSWAPQPLCTSPLGQGTLPTALICPLPALRPPDQELLRGSVGGNSGAWSRCPLSGNTRTSQLLSLFPENCLP